MNLSASTICFTECPRDAMQGIETFIPTAEKIDYLNLLLQVGFDSIDFGSFVSPKAIPQLRDTAEVLDGLNLENTKSKLLAIVANTRGAIEACAFPQIHYLGFPLSLSETFQQRNTNKSIAEAYPVIAEIQNLCLKHGKEMVVYLSMGFGNPYNDPYEPAYIAKAIERLDLMRIKHILPSDTIGAGNAESIRSLFEFVIPQFPHISFGAHLHSNPYTAVQKIEAAYAAGCRKFDTSLKGIGGCPMATDQLVGNMATETLMQFVIENKIGHLLNTEKFNLAYTAAERLFAKYH